MDKQSGIKGPPGGAATPGKAFVMVYPQVANYKGDLTVAVAIRKEGKIAATIHPFVLPTQRGIAIEKKIKNK